MVSVRPSACPYFLTYVTKTRYSAKIKTHYPYKCYMGPGWSLNSYLFVWKRKIVIHFSNPPVVFKLFQNNYTVKWARRSTTFFRAPPFSYVDNEDEYLCNWHERRENKNSAKQLFYFFLFFLVPPNRAVLPPMQRD